MMDLIQEQENFSENIPNSPTQTIILTGIATTASKRIRNQIRDGHIGIEQQI